ncbi:LysR family transcriptional regulator [Azoarcus sp. KH32C]|uniref:LysR family transcriptional regulator n=1 Tax=Azoarcus sp. KH32C TaxID=748247 RepID=UPI0002386547|nr:LysR family transcriptional regulator [Azoarcus sp. KH32C]BAL25793.1 transcriptional regulator, LysR family [Azoarcus sp. KH32C]
MNLRFVEAFLWVARLKSVTRAADKLCLTQSAVSSRIASLEEELGVPLIDRRERHFRLTNSGNRFLVFAERLLDIQREMKDELGAPEPQAMTLRIGGIESVLHTWLIPLVEHLRRTQPHIEFELTVEMSPVIVEHLRRGSLDLAFAAMPAAGEGIRVEEMPSLEMVFVGRRADAERAERWTLTEILDRDVLTFQRGSQPHVALVELIRRAGLESGRIHTISSISALVRMVEGGFGFATLPRATVPSLARGADLAVLDTEARLASLPIHASYWAYPGAPQLEAAVQEAIAFVRRFPVDGVVASEAAAEPAKKRASHRKNR